MGSIFGTSWVFSLPSRWPFLAMFFIWVKLLFLGEYFLLCHNNICFSYGSFPPNMSTLHSWQVWTFGRLSRIFCRLLPALQDFPKHFCLRKFFPPFLGLSKQFMHCPQSLSALHPLQSPHCLGLLGELCVGFVLRIFSFFIFIFNGGWSETLFGFFFCGCFSTGSDF